MALDNNNNNFTAVDFGILTPATARDGSTFFATRSDSVSSVDDVNDFFKLRLDTASSLEVGLSGLGTGSATIDLFRNSNNSIFGDKGEIIKSINIPSGSGEFTVDGLGAGEYFARVAKTGSGTTNFRLDLAATAGAGREREPNGFSQPQNLDALNGSRLMTGSVNVPNDIDDVYRFRVDVPTIFGATLVPSGSNVNLELRNSSNKVIASSLNPNLSLDSVFSDKLQPGEYTVIPFKGGSGTGNYTLSLSATPINQARLSVDVERIAENFDDIFDESGIFGGALFADFYTKVTIGGVTQTSRTFKDENLIDPNFTATQTVNPNDAKIPFKIEVLDADPGPDDRADINPIKGLANLNLTYDTLTGEITGNGIGVQQEGDLIRIFSSDIPRSDGDRAGISFRVNYDTFGFGSTASVSSNTPTLIGTNASQTLTGKDIGGILDGKGGNDKLFAKGGDDIVLGGNGWDMLNGGCGDDILYGGKGRDTQKGGRGSDTFVLTAGPYTDVIKDFRNGVDHLGLTNGLAFEALEVVRQGCSTVIRAGEDRLAVLQDVRPDQITAEDFVSIGFTQAAGITVPSVLA